MGLRCWFGHDWDGVMCRRCGSVMSTSEARRAIALSTATEMRNATASRASEPPNGALKTAGQSKLFPDFPLHPQNLFRMGQTIDGQVAADAAGVMHIVLKAVMDLAGRNRSTWPEFADREMLALATSMKTMNDQIPRQFYPRINEEEIARLASDYFRRFESETQLYERFRKADISVYFLCIDFLNTIACGGTLQTAWERYQ